MSGNLYTTTFEEVAVTVAQDLFQILGPADAVCEIHSLTISQSSDAGDAESEMLNLLIHLGTTNGSGGTTPTPQPTHFGGAAAGAVVEANNTTQSTEGTILESESFNVLAGIPYVWTPETRLHVSPSDIMIFELQTAPTDELTMSGVLKHFEYGG